MSVTIGWWAIPTLVTALAFASMGIPNYSSKGDYDFATPLFGCVHLLAAAIVSLVAWLIWALVA